MIVGLVASLALALMLESNQGTTPPSLKGDELLVNGDLEQTIERLNQAMKEKPQAHEYRRLWARIVETHVGQKVLDGQTAFLENKLDLAEKSFREALRYHPENMQAQAGIARVQNGRRNSILLDDAQAAFNRNEFEVAKSLVRSVLAREPHLREAKLMLSSIETKMGEARTADNPQIAALFRRPVSVAFRDAPLRSIFDALSIQGGLNFAFDRDVNLTQTGTLAVADIRLSDALDTLLASNRLAKKVLNGNTLLIYPATPAKHRDYQETIVKSFFLTHANAKETVALIRSMAKIRDVHLDERLNMVSVRDIPEAVALAEKLVNMSDRAEAEVMLEVEIMEVNGNKLQELGILLPTQFGILGTTIGSGTAGTSTQERLTVQDLRDINSSRIGVIPNPALNILKTDGGLNLLANPRIRVKNSEKARIHIGDKLPVITSNVTSTGVTSESVNYLDVGLKFDVEPLVRLDGEVEMKVSLEVSNIAGTVKTSNGTLAYQLGSRNASTVLRLRDGETQVLAGLISDSERSSANRVPGLSDMPLVGRLFTNKRDEATKSEIILLITPRVLRNIERPELIDAEFFGGTEGRSSSQPLQMRQAPLLLAPNNPGDAGDRPADQGNELRLEMITPEIQVGNQGGNSANQGSSSGSSGSSGPAGGVNILTFPPVRSLPAEPRRQ